MEKNNRRITIEKKIEAVEYAINVKSNYKAAEKFGVSEWTIRYWKNEIEDLKKASKKKLKITLHSGHPLSEERINLDIKLLEFVEINRKLGNPISIHSLVIEQLKLEPKLADITYHGQYESIQRFMKRNNLSLRVPGHIGQLLPFNIQKTISDYIIDLRRIINNGGYSESMIVNMDETPLFLNMPPNKTVTNKGNKSVVIRTTNQEKIRITCMLAICGDGDKLAPYIIFKGIKPSYHTLNLLNGNKYVKDKLIFFNFNQNAWSTTEIMQDWLNKVYLPYINKDPLLGSGLLIIDKASSHIADEVLEKCCGNLRDVSILPGGCTSIMQPLDVAINRPFKNYLKELYIKHCLEKNNTFAKIKKTDILEWIGMIWYDDKLITKSMIYNSFKTCGLSNKTDGSEDNLIKINDFLKNKIIEINEEEEYKNTIQSKIEDANIKIQNELFNNDELED